LPNKNKIIFAPVSSAQGVGEYMRSLIIAKAVSRIWPQLEVQFIINRKAPYADEVPFPVHLINSSPTKEIDAVNDVVSNERPDLIIFDCSGRAAQYRHASKLGVKVVFISQHKKKRRKGFSLRRLPYVYQHWIAQLKFVDGDISVMESIKQGLFGAKPPIFIGPVYDDSMLDILIDDDLPEKYIIYSSGGGGYKMKEGHAPDVFSLAAAEVYKETGISGLVILGINYNGAPEQYDGVRYVRQLENAELISVLNHAFLAVLSGGDLMSQAMTIKQVVVAVPVAKDQAARIRSFVDNGLVVKADANSRSISNRVIRLLENDVEHRELQNRMADADIKNGLGLAVSAIGDLLEQKAGA